MWTEQRLLESQVERETISFQRSAFSHQPGIIPLTAGRFSNTTTEQGIGKWRAAYRNLP
jgi:hypothetical protein